MAVFVLQKFLEVYMIGLAAAS